MLRVLAVMEHYLPGYRYGGPIRTLANIAASLPPEVRMRILTRDRDFGDDRPFAGVPLDAWHPAGGAEVRYLPPAATSLGGLRSRLAAGDYDLLYLNSLFSPLTRRLLLLRRLGALPRRPVLLAPRGELSPGALALKARKKAVFLGAARASGLLRGLVWQGSTPLEAAEIRAALGPAAEVGVAADLAVADGPAPAAVRPPKRPGSASFVFLSRISPKKNLLGALDALSSVRGEATLDVIGTEEDAEYTARCRARAATLPPGVRCTFHGPVPPDAVDGEMAARHFFLFPTRSENFGHVIVEALRVGTPVLVGDQTPWRGLEAAGAGWDLPLEPPDAFRSAVQRCVDMGAEEYARLSEGARAFARSAVRIEEALDAQLALFRRAAARGLPG